MKKQVKVEKYHYQSYLGEIITNAYVYIDEDSLLEFSNNGLSEKVEYDISSEEIFHLEKLIALRFYEENSRNILLTNKTLSAQEVYGILLVMQINKNEMAKLLGTTRGSITHIIKGERKISRPLALLLLERMKMSLEFPEKLKSLIASDPHDKKDVENLHMSSHA